MNDDTLIPRNLNIKQKPETTKESINMDLIMECSEELLTPTELNAYKQIEQNDDSIMKKLLHSSINTEKYPSVQNISSFKDGNPNEISNMSGINIPLNSNGVNVPMTTNSNLPVLNKTFIITPLTTPIIPLTKQPSNMVVNNSEVPPSGLITTNTMIIGTNTLPNAASKMPIIFIPNKPFDMKQFPTVITKVEKPLQLVQTPSHSQLPILLPAIKTSDNLPVNQLLIPVLTNDPSLPERKIAVILDKTFENSASEGELEYNDEPKKITTVSNPVLNEKMSKNNLCKDDSNTGTILGTFIVTPSFPISVNETTEICPVKSNPVKKCEEKKSTKKLNKELNITVESLTMPSMMCYECNNYLTATHFGRFLNCGSCNYSTYCSKAFVNHMIYTHSKLKTVHKTRNLKPVFLKNPATCDCSFHSFNGNSIARHLVKCKKLSCKVIWKNSRVCTESAKKERIYQSSSNLKNKNLAEKINRQEKKPKVDVKIKTLSPISELNISESSRYHLVPITDTNVNNKSSSYNQEKKSDECLDILKTSESSFESVLKTECSSPKSSTSDIEIMEEESLYFEIEENTSNLTDEIEIIDNQ